MPSSTLTTAKKESKNEDYDFFKSLISLSGNSVDSCIVGDIKLDPQLASLFIRVSLIILTCNMEYRMSAESFPYVVRCEIQACL